MVKISIIGWYGTETIGDRGILAGLLETISLAYADVEIQLGAIHPTLTERTLVEDIDFYKLCTSNDNLKISLFNSAKIKELNTSLRWADIVMIGGGPLMNTDPIYMLEYAFSKAKKMKKKTVVAGCGMGPLSLDKYIKSVLSILKKSDLIIFRDSKSIDLYKQFYGNENIKTCYASIDPAVFACQKYLEKIAVQKNESQITINFREIADDVFGGVTTSEIEKKLADMVKNVAKSTEKTVKLIPMHTFSTGGDDRIILNRIANIVRCDNVDVQNIPLSLKQTMDEYYHSEYCIGMRFHSILFQSILNGKNYIIDYTDPKNGKTVNLLEQLHAADFYKDKYHSLLDKNSSAQISFSVDSNSLQFKEPKQIIDNFKNIYTLRFDELMKV